MQFTQYTHGLIFTRRKTKSAPKMENIHTSQQQKPHKKIIFIWLKRPKRMRSAFKHFNSWWWMMMITCCFCACSVGRLYPLSISLLPVCLTIFSPVCVITINTIIVFTIPMERIWWASCRTCRANLSSKCESGRFLLLIAMANCFYHDLMLFRRRFRLVSLSPPVLHRVNLVHIIVGQFTQKLWLEHMKNEIFTQ